MIAGLYERFTLDPLRAALLAAARRADMPITFLTGRDAASLAWFTAKQHARIAADARQLGLCGLNETAPWAPGLLGPA
ncbi:hypothetical protein [Streptomyces collinus]|uniref:hypothetical protein n=1 Tax=Streptomyces collinus TaxID=42684 RepID=UPI0029434F72|nr:hypothetical protein [Streptomyces collinus]